MGNIKSHFKDTQTSSSVAWGCVMVDRCRIEQPLLPQLLLVVLL